jgi:hypothetical protein
MTCESYVNTLQIHSCRQADEMNTTPYIHTFTCPVFASDMTQIKGVSRSDCTFSPSNQEPPFSRGIQTKPKPHYVQSSIRGIHSEHILQMNWTCTAPSFYGRNDRSFSPLPLYVQIGSIDSRSFFFSASRGLWTSYRISTFWKWKPCLICKCRDLWGFGARHDSVGILGVTSFCSSGGPSS